MLSNTQGKLFFLFLLLSFSARAQDTLKINIQQADSIFISQSFYLLAAAMNVEAQKAQIIQAKLYASPVFTADVNAYDPENNKIFHTGRYGQKSFQIEQLVILGGKRKTEIEMAKTNVQIAELEFQQLTRQLKFRLHCDLFSVGQQQLLLTGYNNQLKLLDTLLAAYQEQVVKGNFPLKDVVRLKAAYLKLNNDLAEVLEKYYQAQADLQTLLQTNAIVSFSFTAAEIEKYIKQFSYSEIEMESFLNQGSLQLMEQNKLFAEQYFDLQKKLAKPDINVFLNYDQNSGAFKNQVNAGVSLPLNIRNKNQGNIKLAQHRLMEAAYNQKVVQNEIKSSLQNSYHFYQHTVAEYQKAAGLYNEDFEITVLGMTNNFLKRNVSIIEFIDFFEAYNEVLTELTRIKTQLVISGEQLNLLIGKDIY